ncbi:hypothetical protein KC622_03065 [Candidatus Dojkabacteria bacterium]|uniref:Uncharacterized protein n=1 Tax=Candidatus Dojkabacteria bacterium TaxID=2099670 RepID=A0A955HYC5_9BACT|nr:hypothetical protein [Candidatus Dojkabacteria bacterium]MCB9790850.1 hypothetical protein [Candidatus Nomurabacteria bacterium]
MNAQNNIPSFNEGAQQLSNRLDDLATQQGWQREEEERNTFFERQTERLAEYEKLKAEGDIIYKDLEDENPLAGHMYAKLNGSEPIDPKMGEFMNGYLATLKEQNFATVLRREQAILLGWDGSQDLREFFENIPLLERYSNRPSPVKRGEVVDSGVRYESFDEYENNRRSLPRLFEYGEEQREGSGDVSIELDGVQYQVSTSPYRQGIGGVLVNVKTEGLYFNVYLNPIRMGKELVSVGVLEHTAPPKHMPYTWITETEMEKFKNEDPSSKLALAQKLVSEILDRDES